MTSFIRSLNSILDTMDQYREHKNIELPKNAEMWQRLPDLGLSGLISLDADEVGKGRVQLVEITEVMEGDLVYTVRHPRAEFSHNLLGHPNLDKIRDLMNDNIGNEIIVGGYHPFCQRFQIHYLNVEGKEFLN